MKNYKQFLFMFCFALVVFFSFVSVAFANESAKSYDGEYSDVYSFLCKYADAMETYADDIEKSQNKDDFLAAVAKYSNSYESFVDEKHAISGKYPNFKKDTEEIPEFIEVNARILAAARRVANFHMSRKDYFSDPEVREAMKKMRETTSK